MMPVSLSGAFRRLSFASETDRNQDHEKAGVARSSGRALFRAEDGLVLILLASLALNLFGNDFPIVYHVDEIKKLNFIAKWKQDFMHPLLLLQIVRIPNLWFGYDSSLSLAVLGRSMVGLMGAVLVVLVYCLVRRAYTPGVSLWIAASVAFCPTIVIHSHYIKEDILLTACLTGSLIAISKFVERPSALYGGWMGLFLGLAFSSHYKSFLLVPLFFVFTLHEIFAVRRGWIERQFEMHPNRIPIGGSVALVVSVGVFLVINFPTLRGWDVFTKGFIYEVNHAVDGHRGFRIYPMTEWFTYHLRYNLFPGMTPAMCLFGLIGLMMVLVRWTAVSPLMRLVALFTILFYLIPEISPTKPPPDDGRYMIPVAVGLLCCVAEWIYWLLTLRTGVQRLVFSIYAFSLFYALIDSTLLTLNLNRDTRATADLWIRDHLPSEASVAFCRSSSHGDGREVDSYYPTVQGSIDSEIDFLVVSSFQYDRFFYVIERRGQDTKIYEQAWEFQRLFQLPYKEFRPHYRSFAFSNPVIRIVQLGERFHLPFDPVDSDTKVKSQKN